MYFDRDGELFQATRVDPGASFEQITPLTNLNSTGYDGGAVISRDGQTLFWISGRRSSPSSVLTRRAAP